MRLTAALLTLLITGPAHATPEYVLPTLFDVFDVEASDRLNVREGPGTSFAIIGNVGPTQTDIEIVAEERGWGRVNFHEFSGWISMRYLRAQNDVWQTGALPAGFSCHGTEPFWAVAQDGDNLTLSLMDEADRSVAMTAILDDRGFRSPMRAVTGEGVTLVSTPAVCSDGMSDRVFGLRASLVLTGDSPRLFSGCCSIQPPLGD